MACRSRACVYPAKSAEPIEPPYIPSESEKGLNHVCYGPRSKALKIQSTDPNDPTSVYGRMPSQFCDVTERDIKTGCVRPSVNTQTPQAKRPPMSQTEAQRYAVKSFANYDSGCPNCRLSSCTGCRQYLSGQPYAAYCYDTGRPAEQNGRQVVNEATVARYPATGGNCDRDDLSFTIMPSKRSAPMW